MQAAAFVAQHGAADDEVGGHHQVSQLDEVTRYPETGVVLVDLVVQQLDAMLGAGQALVGAHDAHVVPHEAAQLIPVVRDDDFLVGIGDSAGVPLRQRRDHVLVLGEDVLGGGAGEHETFQQRVGGEPVGAVQSGEGHLAGSVKPLHIGAAVEVGHDAAAGVVGGGHDRNRLSGDVYAQFHALGVDIGEVGLEEVRRFVRDIEIDAVQAAFFHLVVDGAGDDVARSEFRPRVVLGHEARAVGQLEQAAFAAHRLGDEERLGVRVVEAGGVELDEFHVGDPAPGPPTHGHAIAGRRIGVGCVEVHLARSAGGQHGVEGTQGFDLAGLFVEHVGPVAAVVGHTGLAQFEFPAGNQVDGDVLFHHFDVRVAADALHQRLLHCRTGGVIGVNDAPVAVAALPGQVKLAGVLLVAGKGHAGLDEPVDGALAVGNDVLGGVAAAQTGTGDERVLDMVGHRVVAAQHAGNAALGPTAGAIQKFPFGHQRYAPVLGQVQGKRHAGQAAADDDDVEATHKFSSGFAVTNDRAMVSEPP